MSDEWRMWLYPLGLLPQMLFTLRFLVQWLMSERRGESTVPPSFWRLSLVGHSLMVVHACLQMQFHLSIVQGWNGVIAWRNLDLMGQRRYSMLAGIILLPVIAIAITLFFLWQAPIGLDAWFRSPIFPGKGEGPLLSWGWHLFGTAGIILFSSRFWVQWWQAERSQRSSLGLAFWWITCTGNAMMLLYFWQLGDPINAAAPLLAMAPTVRNLILLHRMGAKEVASHV